MNLNQKIWTIPTINFTIPIFVLILLSLLFASPIQAQDNVTDDEVNDVAKGLYCPVCESTPLDVCPTQACADWRELIREQLASGMSKEEIYDYFSVQYGDGVLAEPPRRGFSLLLWLSPLLALAVGGFVFIKAMRQLKSASKPEPSAVDETTVVASKKPPSNDIQTYIDRIEAELKELPNG